MRPTPRGVPMPKRALISKFVFLLLFLMADLLLAAVVTAQSKPAPGVAEKTIVIHAATLIDGASNQPRHNVLIVVKGNRIESVSEGGNPPAGATVINFGS